MMTGTSPFPMQSPSYHSASYMPKLEANFMRDFACCGTNLPTLHDLLQHYEEMHAQQTPQSLRTTAAAQRARDNPVSSKTDIVNQTASSVQHQNAQQQQNHQARPGLQIPQGAPPVGGISLLRQQPQSQPATPIQKNMQTIPDDGMDGVEDMEMDDAIDSMNQAPDTPIQQNQNAAQQSLFGQQPRPQLNMNLNGMQYSGLRTSQPPTPATVGYGFQHNPTVSSVNTPTLSTQSMQQGPFSTHTSLPGTPGEMDDDYTSFPMNLNMGTMTNQQYPFGFGGNDMGLDLCIDEPARRLYQPNGGGQQSQKAMAQQFAQFGLGQGQLGNNNSDLMLAYQQQQQQMLGMNGMTPQQAALAVMMAEEHKPFKCPVIGCEKAYKNQNGLKYVPLLDIITFWTNFATDIIKHMVIKPNSYTKMEMEHSRSLIPKLQFPIKERLEWRKRSHTDVTSAESDTRT
jgi:transcription factor SFP1